MPVPILMKAVVGVLLSISCLACSSHSRTIKSLRIGVIAPLSETSTAEGEATVAGAKLAVEEINAAGGLVLDHQPYHLELVLADNQDNPTQAVIAAKQLINGDQVIALVGLPNSRSAIPVADIAEQAQIPMISTTSTNPLTTQEKSYVFRMVYTDDFQGKMMAQFTYDNLDNPTVAVLYDRASAYQQGIADIFQQEYRALGGQIVAFEAYTTDHNQEFQNQLAVIQTSQAQALFLPNYADEVIKQARQARAMGIEAILLGADAWNTIPSSEWPLLTGSFFSLYWLPDLADPETRAFFSAYEHRYGQPLIGADGPLAYDAVNMLVQAIQHQNSADPEQIRQGLLSMQPFKGVTGSLQFLENGDPRRDGIIVQITPEQVLPFQAMPF